MNIEIESLYKRQKKKKKTFINIYKDIKDFFN